MNDYRQQSFTLELKENYLKPIDEGFLQSIFLVDSMSRG